MITKIYYKKNELFNIEFFKNEGCTDPFEFLNEKSLYIKLKEGDISPFLEIYKYSEYRDIYLPYFPNIDTLDYLPSLKNIYTFDDIAPNLSKYIAEDNAVLFLSEEDKEKYKNSFLSHHKGWHPTKFNDGTFYVRDIISGNRLYNPKKATIFISHGTETKLKEVIELAKSLKKQCGVKEVNLFVLHCFISLYGGESYINSFVSKGDDFPEFYSFGDFFNKIITTNSTDILLIQNKERLQIIDCYDIFNDYLQNKNE